MSKDYDGYIIFTHASTSKGLNLVKIYETDAITYNSRRIS